jgi:flagellar motor protein MotB
MLMKKTIALIGTSALLLFLGAATPSYAQEQHDDQGKPEAAPPKTPSDKPSPDKEKAAKPPKEQPKPEQPKTAAKSPQQADKQTEQQQKDQEKAQKDQEKTQKQQKAAQKQTEQQRQYAQQNAPRENADRPQGGGNGRIPDDRFKAHFGREHHFHVGHPEIVGGHPQFSYGGYSFIIVEAWPAGWGYDDDVYIIDDGGVYYLCDLAHPGVQLELQVVL